MIFLRVDIQRKIVAKRGNSERITHVRKSCFPRLPAFFNNKPIKMCLPLEPQPRFEIFPFMSLHSLASGLAEKEKASVVEYFKLLVSFHKKYAAFDA